MLNFEVTEFSMTQHLEIPLTNIDTSSVTMSLSTDRYNKKSTGSLTASFRRIMSPDTWLEVSFDI